MKKVLWENLLYFTSDILSKKYLVNENGLIGYKSGLSFANFLGLTTQTASVE